MRHLRGGIMTILTEPISENELRTLAGKTFGDMIKGVVDVGKKQLALDAELHADLEAFLLEQGSEQKNLWGINLYPGLLDDDFVEFDSMINLRPSQGNRSRGVEDAGIQQQIRDVVFQWVKRS